VTASRTGRALVLAGVAVAAFGANRAMAAAGESPAASQAPAYADLVDLLEPAPLVLVVQIRKVAQVEPERARDVRPDRARLYVEARGLEALRGALPAPAPVSYLADVPRDAKGKLPPLAKRSVLLVALPVAQHPEMLQLVAPDAQLPWDAALAVRVRAVLAALAAPDAPSPVTGVREAIHVAGALAGEGETQIFLATANGSPAAITVIHQPGKAALGAVKWSVSFSEVLDASGQPPARDTLAWYRLACFLPRDLPKGVNVSATAGDQARAAQDYQLVMEGLGPCGRAR